LFFFADSSPSAFCTLSLHDALPISREAAGLSQTQLSALLNDLGVRLNRQAVIALEAKPQARRVSLDEALAIAACLGVAPVHLMRSEEHTSELQSLRHLVCRLLLEKK